MRKIIESTLVSADGVIGSPPLWAMDYRDEEVTGDALERLSGSDAMLMGRGTYELFAAAWPGQTDDFAHRLARGAAAVAFTCVTAADKAQAIAQQIGADGGRAHVSGQTAPTTRPRTCPPW